MLDCSHGHTTAKTSWSSARKARDTYTLPHLLRTAPGMIPCCLNVRCTDSFRASLTVVLPSMPP